MDFSLLQLIVTFLSSIVLGLALAIVYEPIKIFHLCGFNKSLHYFITDVSFFIFCGFVTYFFCIVTLEGKVRLFIVFGELLGYFCYFRLIAPYTEKIFVVIIKICKKILSNLLKKSRELLYNIKHGFSCLFNFIKSACVKLGSKMNKGVVNNEKIRYRTNGEYERNKRKFSKRNKRSKAKEEKIK